MKHIQTNLFYILFTVLSIQACKAQNTKNVFTIMSYNVENLFDTINTPEKRDDEYTPEGKKHWNTERYNKKINNLAKVITSVETNELPELVGLCEVENINVVKDLMNKVAGKVDYYGYIHKESPDRRGIDVALAYRKDEFVPIEKAFLPVNFSFSPRTKTRDILYVKGVASGLDTLFVFVNHWSSRMGGMAKSEKKRITAAKILRNKVDSILQLNKNAKIIIIGDFNDEPTNYSISYYLQANNKRLNAKSFELYNLMYDISNIEKRGTYSYKNKWDMLDNIIVSQNLLYSKTGYHTGYDAGKIYKAEWIMYFNKKANEFIPSRTYVGNYYYSGFSDHLSVYFQLVKDK